VEPHFSDARQDFDVVGESRDAVGINWCLRATQLSADESAVQKHRVRDCHELDPQKNGH
jgi:hypothetical protein